MSLKMKLIVDGKIVDGVFGAPVWSQIVNNFLVIRQKGGVVEIVEV